MTDEGFFLRMAVSIPASAVVLGGTFTALAVAQPGADMAEVMNRFRWIAAPECVIIATLSNLIAARLLVPRTINDWPLPRRLQM
ncbi:hypothetical protein [Gellertiella hungarica]|uniref:Uncharacterized protein n=1 Tax=Gellertiella hungarica TaxID=1572859 RepID=A0A7W6J8B8_9HYPH|nr:hypothetical protein [Gellertiella hungarica]MBB4066646.1 hypothetical protein [Gellertiella hungarica]